MPKVRIQHTIVVNHVHVPLKLRFVVFIFSMTCEILTSSTVSSVSSTLYMRSRGQGAFIISADEITKNSLTASLLKAWVQACEVPIGLRRDTTSLCLFRKFSNQALIATYSASEIVHHVTFHGWPVCGPPNILSC